jgi:hypothetical protein
MKIDIRIMACPGREGMIIDMLNQLNLGLGIVTFDDRPGGGDPLYTARATWTVPVPKGVTHRAVLQDDLELCDDFAGILEQAVSAFPRSVFSLYSARVRMEHRQKGASPYLEIPGGGGCYGQAIVMPVSLIAPCFEWIDSTLGAGYNHSDTAISEFCNQHSVQVLTTIPSLVQHLAPTASKLGYNNKRKVSKVWRGRAIANEGWSNATFKLGPRLPNNLYLKTPYNTALKSSSEYPARHALPEIDWFENDRGIIFYHDLCQEPDPRQQAAYARAACIYAEPAWEHGYNLFAERAGTKQTGDFPAFIRGARALAESLGVPAFITAAKSWIGLLDPPLAIPVRLNGSDSLLAVWHAEPPKATDSAGIIAELAGRYLSVADFCCGYGRTLRAFPYFIGSDIDRKCLGYIKTEIMPKPLSGGFK